MTGAIVSKTSESVNTFFAKMPVSQTVGERLLEAFKDKGITSKVAIAAALGYKSDKSIYKVINGQQELGFEALRLFSEKTGRSIDWLLMGKEPVSADLMAWARGEKPPQANESQPESTDENQAELRDLLSQYFADQELLAFFHAMSRRDRAKLMALAKGSAYPESIPTALAQDSGTELQKKAS